MEDGKKETISSAASPEEVFERYLGNVKTQIEGGEIKREGIYDNIPLPFGTTSKDAERVLKLVQKLGYKLRWSEKVEERHWIKELISPSEYVIIQLTNFSKGPFEFCNERPAGIMFFPYGKQKLGKELKITGEELRQELAKEVLRIIDIFLDGKIPFSKLDEFAAAEYQYKVLPVLKVDFPEGKKEISVKNFE